VTDRPHPPGAYPVVVIGSGPGGLQTSYELARYGVRHALLSADGESGGTFLRWPHFQRLITWTKPHASVARTTRWYERYDWNSLVAGDDELRGTVAAEMDGASYFPTRAEMQRGLREFARRAAIVARHGCRWETTRRDGEAYVVETSDGDYRASFLVVATGMTRPYRAPIPGLEHVPHYAEVKPLDAYRDRRVLIVGKRNSGFELADGLLPHARQIVLVSPSTSRFSLETHTTAGVRARYVQPFEDHVLRGGVFVLDASVERIDRAGTCLVAQLRPSSGGDAMSLEFDEVIAATGFTSDLRPLAALAPKTHGHLAVPAQTPLFESMSLPGVFLAGTLTQGARGLRKHGVPSASASVHGFRYNARIAAREIARRLGVGPRRRLLPRDDVVPFLLGELTRGPELWLQRSYLAHVLVPREEGIVDEGIVPLQDFVDADGPDAIAAAIELDAAGESYPVLYVRRAGAITERALDTSALLSFETDAHRRQIAAILSEASTALA